jgi:hypothetical protein
MLKRLAILAITALATIVPLAAQPNQTADQKQQPAKQGQPSPVTSAPEKHDSGDQQKGETSADAPNWYAAFENPDGMLVIVGLITCVVIGWQSWETRDAAKGAHRAADASFAQIELMREKERARVIVEPIDLKVQIDSESEPPDWYLTATVKVDNIGASRAFDIDGRASLWVQDSSSPITPPEFRFPWSSTRAFQISVEPGSYVVSVDSQLPVDSQDRELTVDQLLKGLYGSVEGESTVPPKKAIFLQGSVKYESMGVRFCRRFGWCWILMGEDMGGIVLGGTSEEGSWCEDRNQKNDEHPSPN